MVSIGKLSYVPNKRTSPRKKILREVQFWCGTKGRFRANKTCALNRDFRMFRDFVSAHCHNLIVYITQRQARLKWCLVKSECHQASYMKEYVTVYTDVFGCLFVWAQIQNYNIFMCLCTSVGDSVYVRIGGSASDPVLISSTISGV